MTNKKFLTNNVYLMFYITLLLIVTALPAVLVAIECNKDNKILYGILAFSFQWCISATMVYKKFF